MKYRGIVICFVIFGSLVSCRKSVDPSYMTIIFPNMPWEYQTSNMSSWIKGKGEICSVIDSIKLSDPDTIICRVRFNLDHPRKFRSFILESNLQSNYMLYLNGFKIRRITNYPLPPGMYEKLTDSETEKKYVKRISYHTDIPDKLFNKKKNELLIVAFDHQPIVTGLRPNIQLFAKHSTPKILKNFNRNSGSSLPVIKINTFEKEIPDEPRIKSFMEVSIPYPPHKKKFKNKSIEYSGLINIELRGSTSQSYTKKSYNIETIDSVGNNLNVSLLNLPKENDWVLYGPYLDKSQIRNVLAYNLFGKMGHYSPGTKFCELILNDKYKGIYVLIEKIKIDKNRVNISKLTKNDDSGINLTGGYIVSIDKNLKGFIWCSSYTRHRSVGATYYNCYYPKFEDSNEAQNKYIMNFFNSFEDNIYYNSDLSQLYDSIIDIQSFIDYFIINELTKNIDAYRLSTYFHKDRDNIDRKLYIGPVWDFNLSFGLPDYLKGYHIEGWVYKENEQIIPFWWQNLLNDQTFKNALVKRWFGLREGVLSSKSLIHTIDSISNVISNAVDRNYNEYDLIGKQLIPCYFTGSTYTDELNYLKFWLNERLIWMDENMGK
jgi:hypothetical protein